MTECHFAEGSYDPKDLPKHTEYLDQLCEDGGMARGRTESELDFAKRDTCQKIDLSHV